MIILIERSSNILSIKCATFSDSKTFWTKNYSTSLQLNSDIKLIVCSVSKCVPQHFQFDAQCLYYCIIAQKYYRPHLIFDQKNYRFFLYIYD